MTAAIVGVILNLAVWFALHVFFPDAGVIDWFAIVLCVAAFVAMLRYKIDIIPVVLAADCSACSTGLCNAADVRWQRLDSV